MSDSAAIVVWTISLILSVFFSGMEMAFVSSDKLRYALDQKNKNPIDFIQRVFFSRPRKFLSALTIGNLIALVFFVHTSIILSQQFISQNITENELLALFFQFLGSSIIILVAGELLPRTIFKNNSNLWVKILALPAFLFYLLLYPIIHIFASIGSALLRLIGIKFNPLEDKALGRVELDAYVKQGIEEMPSDGSRDSEVKIFRNALDFSSVKLRDCMVPRTDIVAVSIDTDIDELKEEFIETGFSKILVYEEDIESIVGYIHIWEMFSNPIDWTKKINPISYYPESMLAKDLMSELLQDRKTIAVVVDEFGGISGIITMEDLVEEIFGDIEDEYDVNPNKVVKKGDNYKIPGRMEIDQLNELYDLNFPQDDDYTTIAGYILHHLQRFPDEGEIIEIDNNTFRVIEVSERKIEDIELIVNHNNR